MSDATKEIFTIFQAGSSTIQSSQEAMAQQLEVLASKLEKTYDDQTKQSKKYLDEIKNAADAPKVKDGTIDIGSYISQKSTLMNACDTLYRTLETSYNACVQSGQSSLSTLGNSASEFIESAKASFSILTTISQALSGTL